MAQNSFSDCIVVSADQVAVKDGVIREKPQTKEECYRYLESYCNSGVELFSAVCVYNTNTGKKYVNCDVSAIEVRVNDLIPSSSPIFRRRYRITLLRREM